MKNKKSILKILILSITSIFLGGAVLSTSAATSKNTLKLSKEEAVKLAMKNNNDLKRIETGLDTLHRKFKKYKDLSKETEDAQHAFAEYKSAYKKINSEEFKNLKKQLESTVQGYAEAQKNLTQLEEQLKTIPNTEENKDKIAAIKAGIEKAKAIINKINQSLAEKGTNIDTMNKKYAELQAELAKFEAGKTKLIAMGLADKETGAPKELTSKEEYNIFIKPRDIPWYTVQCMIQKTVKKRELANETVDFKIKEAYNNLLYAEEGYNLKKQLYDRMLKGYNDLVKSYEVGMASELQKNLTKIELDKTKLDLDNLKRNIENGQIQFKKTLGIDLKEEVQLSDNLNNSIKEPQKYESYLSSALNNRSEIYDCKVDLEEKKRTFDIIKDYFGDDDYEWLNAEKELDEADVALDDNKKNVKENIQNAYLDVIQKKRQIDLAVKNMDKAKQQLESAKKAYEAETKPISLIWDAELGLNKAQMDHNTALRNYNISLYKLEKASKVGPKY